LRSTVADAFAMPAKVRALSDGTRVSGSARQAAISVTKPAASNIRNTDCQPKYSAPMPPR
jgi:hypothetical protein